MPYRIALSIDPIMTGLTTSKSARPSPETLGCRLPNRICDLICIHSRRHTTEDEVDWVANLSGRSACSSRNSSCSSRLYDPGSDVRALMLCLAHHGSGARHPARSLSVDCAEALPRLSREAETTIWASQRCRARSARRFVHGSSQVTSAANRSEWTGCDSWNRRERSRKSCELRLCERLHKAGIEH
jgi:hypothetical protein